MPHRGLEFPLSVWTNLPQTYENQQSTDLLVIIISYSRWTRQIEAVLQLTARETKMGGVPSIPRDSSRKLEVIGAGFSRTGTVSMQLALEKLLDGAVMHGGTHILSREDGKVSEPHQFRSILLMILNSLRQEMGAGLRRQASRRCPRNPQAALGADGRLRRLHGRADNPLHPGAARHLPGCQGGARRARSGRLGPEHQAHRPGYVPVVAQVRHVPGAGLEVVSYSDLGLWRWHECGSGTRPG